MLKNAECYAEEWFIVVGKILEHTAIPGNAQIPTRNEFPTCISLSGLKYCWNSQFKIYSLQPNQLQYGGCV